jgi:PAS domain S-box-containing protein
MDSERYYKAIFAHSNVGVIATDTEGRLVHWNQTVEEMLGYCSDELRGLNTFDISHPDDLERTEDQFQNLVDGSLDSYQWQKRYRRKDGSHLWGDVSVSAIRDEQGQLSEVLAIVADITDRKRSEEALQRSKRLLTDAQRIGHMGNWDYDVVRNVLWWSDEVYRILGVDADSFTPSPEALLELVHPDDKDFFQSMINRDVSPGGVPSYEYRIVRPDGDVRTLQTIRELTFDDKDRLLRSTGILLDITESKIAEAKLKRSESLLAEAQEIAHLGNWEREVGKETLHWSDETFRLLGAEPGDFEPTLERFLELLHPDDREMAKAEVGRTFEHAVPLSYEHRVILPNGSERILLERGRVACDDQGNVTRLFGTVLDVTEARQAERSLQSSHDGLERIVRRRTRELTAIVETLVEGVITIDSRGTVESINPSAEAIFGYLSREIVGQNVSILMPRKDSEGHDQYLRNYQETGVAKIIGIGREVTGLRKDGTTFPMQLGIGGMDIDGQRKFVGAIHDLTDHNAAHIALSRSERDLRNLTDLSPVGIYRAGIDGGITYANERALTLAGIPRDGASYLGSEWQKYIYPDDLERFVSEFVAAVKSEIPFAGEYRFGRAEGPSTWTLSQALPEFDQNGKLAGYIGTLIDINERKLSELSLAENEERFALAMRGANDAVWDWDGKTASFYFSPRWFEMFGYKNGEVAATAEAWESMLHPDDRSRISNFQRHYVKSSDDSHSIEVRVRHKDGHYVDVLSRVILVRNDEGKITRMVGTNTDISKRKRAEANVLIAKEEAELANKAKSNFLSSMSHELRTPMNAILGYSQLLEQDTVEPLSKRHTGFVDEILNSGHHMLELIGNVLDLAKIESDDLSLDLEDHDPDPLIRTCLNMIAATAEQKNIAIQSRLPERGLPTIKVDSLRFKQALLNLLSNAVKYNQQDGEVLLDCTEASNGIFHVAVSDTGPGISDELHDKVFEPFDRLGAETSDTPGTGIGLTVTKQLIESMGGTVGFESTVGEGTTFWINLPIAR